MSRRSLGLIFAAALAGCSGFQVIGSGQPGKDGGAQLDGSSLTADGATSSTDLAGMPPPDLSTTASTITGPGPLGALPTGFCCSANSQCRDRMCINLGTGPYFCSDFCTSPQSNICSNYTTQYGCHNTSNDYMCTPSNDSYTCVDGNQYKGGSLPTGSCCSVGEDCLGGICIGVGSQNPMFCSQGCDDTQPCPPGYGCQVLEPFPWHPGECWKTQSVSDPTSDYTCK